MYRDEIILMVGVVAVVLSLLFLLYLWRSRKQSKLYSNILKQDRTTINLTTSTTSTTKFANATGATNTTAATELLTQTLQNTQNPEEAETELISSPTSFVPVNFNANVLRGQYTLLGELGGGGMSRVFLARKDNTENEWIVKFVPSSLGKLTDNEANILKTLNHTGIPKIIDIFTTREGLFMVESYIEGTPLNNLLPSGEQRRLNTDESSISATKPDTIPEILVLDWAEEIAQVFTYLHAKEIYHLDVKPSNIIIAEGGRPILIDFGISQRQSSVQVAAATLSYAAPEQLKGAFKKAADVIATRFGALPQESETWLPDGRTDIFSFGVVLFEAAVGFTPTTENMHHMEQILSPEFCKIIQKCLAIHPENRYQSADELLKAIQNHKQSAKPQMAGTLFRRKLVRTAAMFSVCVSVASFAMGFHWRNMEVLAAMHVAPELITVSLGQSTELDITRFLPDAEEGQWISPDSLRWDSANPIVQVSGNRITGIALGETQINGYYRFQQISLNVQVIEPMDGMVDISMRFHPNRYVNLYAGTTYREWTDGPNPEFVRPENMDITDDGRIYFVDSILLRRMVNGITETVDLPTFHNIRNVRTYGNQVFLVTAWEDNYGTHHQIKQYDPVYGLVHLYDGDALATSILDMQIANGKIYFLRRDYNAGQTSLNAIYIDAPEELQTIQTLPLGASSLAVAGERIYIAVEDNGTILFTENNELHLLAGYQNERHFIDGTMPRFYRPTRLRYRDNTLYVWDFNVLRQINLHNGALKDVVSIAGVASPDFDRDITNPSQPAEQIIFPRSLNTDFLPLENGFLLSDPLRGVFWWV